MGGDPVDFKRGLFGGGFSAESLLGSVALHLLGALIVIFFAADRHGGTHRQVVPVDLSQLNAPAEPKSRVDTAPAQAPHEEAQKARADAFPEAGAIPIPKESTADSAPPPAPAAAPEAAPEAAAESGPIARVVPDDDLPPEPTAYQGFIDAVYQRLNEATVRSWRYAGALAQMGIAGGTYHFHVLISLDGRTPAVQFIPEKTSLLFNSSIDAPTADRHLRRFFDLVIADIREGVPYPEAPPRVPLKPFCYDIVAPFPGARTSGAAPPRPPRDFFVSDGVPQR